jgi:transcription antitermination factor NusG
MSDLNRCWFALHVNVRRERVTADALHSRGFENFLPLGRTRHRWSDRIKEVEVPLFPRYLFCRFNVQDRHRVLTTPGVEYIVGIGKIPVIIPPEEIAALDTVMKSAAIAQLSPFLQTGQWVRIEEGALSGLEGILLDFRGSCRLVVSVTLLQRSVAVEIDRLDVTPIAPPRRPRSTVPNLTWWTGKDQSSVPH